MKLFTYRGKRIHTTDNKLLLHYAVALLFPIFMIVLGLWYRPILLSIQWDQNVFDQWKQVNIMYLLGSIITAFFACLGVSYWFYSYHIDVVKQWQHRQKLARMIIENGWCDKEQVKKESIFKDLSSHKTSTKITNFPKCYYKMEKGIICITVEIVSGKAQEQLLHLEKKLESMLFCELIEKELFDGYVQYQFLYDTISRRITIDDVTVENGRMKLMDSLYWEYDQLPHMLIAGGTGGGKTYFLLTIILALSKTNAKLYILDPKNSDLADLSTIMPDVYYKKEDMIQCLHQFYEDMMQRSEEMKLHPNYKTGENYAYIGLEARFLIFDEYPAFMEMIGREAMEVMNKIKQIVMLGRQAGFFMILACQRPDAKYLGDGSRDQFNFRVALGRMSELGMNMMFGESNKDFFMKRIKGRGYVDSGGAVISEFYTPLVPKGYDFLHEIGKHTNNKIEEKETVEEQ